VGAGKADRLHGAAWAGESEVVKVEVSIDGGATWADTRLTDKAVPFAWRLWEWEWPAPKPGRHVLMARATDKRGRVQAAKHDPDKRNYRISHTLPVAVEVR